jgi:HSP20 family protein
MNGATKSNQPSATTELVRYTTESPFGVIREMLERLELATPRVDITHEGEQLVIQVDLPGMSPKDVQVTIDDYSLELEGELNEHRFRRVIPLPQHVDANTAEARMDGGVLEIHVRAPTDRLRGRRLDIKTGGGHA